MRSKTATVDEPVLRNAARPLRSEEIGSERIRELIEHMRETHLVISLSLHKTQLA